MHPDVRVFQSLHRTIWQKRRQVFLTTQKCESAPHLTSPGRYTSIGWLYAPVKLTTVRRFKLTMFRRFKLTTFGRFKLTT
jgi:hypothetical protein